MLEENDSTKYAQINSTQENWCCSSWAQSKTVNRKVLIDQRHNDNEQVQQLSGPMQCKQTVNLKIAHVRSGQQHSLMVVLITQFVRNYILLFILYKVSRVMVWAIITSNDQ